MKKNNYFLKYFFIYYFLIFNNNVHAADNNWQFNNNCIRAIDGDGFQKGLKRLKEGVQSLGNMGKYLSDDQSDRVILLMWQVSSALGETTELLTFRMLKPMIISTRRTDAEEIFSSQLETSVDIIKNITDQLDTSILVFRNQGFRDEIREIRRSLQEILTALSACKR